MSEPDAGDDLLSQVLETAVATSISRRSLYRPTQVLGSDEHDLDVLPSMENGVEVLDLTADGIWGRLYKHFLGTAGNYAPWRRCIAVLHGLNARTCVIEKHYVCLDYRSEISVYHSQLDEPTPNYAIRLHFFEDRLSEEQIFTLSDTQQESYLGYIVCRAPNMPLVGRTVLRVPEYVKVNAAVLEPVNFLGQRLEVVGVPFMQQDARFAVCAEVAAWAVHYSAFRKGIVDRRLVADIVTALDRGKPMHPDVPAGLRPEQVVKLLHNMGINALLCQTRPFTALAVPAASSESLNDGSGEFTETAAKFKALVETPELSEAGFPAAPDAQKISAVKFLNELAQCVEFCMNQALTPTTEGLMQELFSKLTPLADFILFDFVTSYLRSGFPIYADTGDHAMVLCGLTRTDDNLVYYFNDDQFGPYLSSKSIVHASYADFRRQAFADTDSDELAIEMPTQDRSWPELAHPAGPYEATRLVRALVVPGPKRALLSPTAAERDGWELLKIALAELDVAEEAALSPAAKLESDVEAVHDPGLPSPYSSADTQDEDDEYIILTTNLVMGIDFKADRRAQSVVRVQARASDNTVGLSESVRTYSTVHLAEWIVLLEFADQATGDVVYEFAYDSSSGDDRPRLQFARIGSTVLVADPSPERPVRQATIDMGVFRPMVVPLRVGKLR